MFQGNCHLGPATLKPRGQGKLSVARLTHKEDI